MDKNKLKFLLDEDIDLNCSFDGPANVHDKNRIYLKGKSSYAIVSKKIKEILKEKEKKDKSTKTRTPDIFSGILTISKFSLPFHKEIIDEYVKMGFSRIALRPLNHFGLESKIASAFAYSVDDFVDFYKKALDYILEINKQGTLLVEFNIVYFLKKVLTNMDPNYSELRSPCGAAIGQMAFNYDGGIYTCDEGRMASKLGYENFKLGELGKSRMKDVIDNETVKTTCLASCLDSHMGCQSCVYKPYCGTCPVANFLDYGTIFPHITNTEKCKLNKAIFEHIFLKIKNKKNREVFESWLK